MLKGKELGHAIAQAIALKIESGAAASKAEIARYFNVRPPSVSDWESRGSISKDRLPLLWSYFSDVVGPEHWGLPPDGWPTTSASHEPTGTGLSLLDKKTDIVTIPRYNTGGSMGDGVVLHDQPGVIESWRVTKEWLASNVRGYTSAANLCIVTGFGDSMRPTYNPGDPLIVDKGVTTVDFDSIYFFRVGNDGYVKRLQRIPTSSGLLIKALSDNKELYEPFDITPDMDFAVLGRVVQVWRRDDY